MIELSAEIMYKTESNYFFRVIQAKKQDLTIVDYILGSSSLA